MSQSRRRQPDPYRQQQALARETERARKEVERRQNAALKEEARQHRERRAAHVQEMNAGLAAKVDSLQNMLRYGLQRSARIDLIAQRRKSRVVPIDIDGEHSPVPAPAWEDFAPKRPGVLSRTLGNARYERRLAKSKESYRQAVHDAEQNEQQRQARVAAARRRHAIRAQKEQDEVRTHNELLDERIEGLRLRTPGDVEGYLREVLTATPLPSGFPCNVELAFNQPADQLIVQWELPHRDVIPIAASHRYIASKDEVRPAARRKTEINDLYRSAISQVALLCIRDLFDADSALASVAFNGHVHATNPATGEREFPCLISLNVDRSDFPKDENLREVTPSVCVRHLRAIVSNHPYDLEPIDPLLDFDLSKFRFAEGFDAVATLDSRPDLMQMSPSNFEHLVRQIFEAQGAEGWTTEQSHDDGVDAVIAKRTSLIGGLSIVQAKRYSRVVGVSHLRELAGAMEEKKAGWGILVTTSWFTTGCPAKARAHGRMELINGWELQTLIKKHLDKDVLIGIPNRPPPPETPK
jgi:restriction system protein